MSDGREARQALLLAVDQKNYMQAVIGNEKYYKACPSVFMCGVPYETAAGAPKPDVARARQLLKESGYDGRPVVVIDPTDTPYAHGASLVTAAALTVAAALSACYVPARRAARVDAARMLRGD